MDRREMNVDWLARLLGLLGILVGIVACVYFYNQNATRRTEIADAVATINRASDAKDASQTEADDFDAVWDQRLTTALEDFKGRANKAIDKEDRNLSAREDLFRQELAKIALAENDLESLVQQKIEENCDLEQLRKTGIREGMRTLRISGAQKVAAGDTTIEEVMRVAPASQIRS